MFHQQVRRLNLHTQQFTSISVWRKAIVLYLSILWFYGSFPHAGVGVYVVVVFFARGARLTLLPAFWQVRHLCSFLLGSLSISQTQCAYFLHAYLITHAHHSPSTWWFQKSLYKSEYLGTLAWSSGLVTITFPFIAPLNITSTTSMKS